MYKNRDNRTTEEATNKLRYMVCAALNEIVLLSAPNAHRQVHNPLGLPRRGQRTPPR